MMLIARVSGSHAEKGVKGLVPELEEARYCLHPNL